MFGADYANFLESVTAASGDAGGVKQGSGCLAGYWKHHPAKLLQQLTMPKHPGFRCPTYYRYDHYHFSNLTTLAEKALNLKAKHVLKKL